MAADLHPTILLAGGGTGGHLYPGISVAESLRGLLPQCRPLFLCTERAIDTTILKPTGFDFITQPIVPMQANISGLLRFWKGLRETVDLVKGIIKEHQPVAVLGLGGYAATMAVKVGAKQGVPAAMLNPDVIPGKANRYLMDVVKAVCCQFEATRGHVSSSKQARLRMTGCPIREDIKNLPSRTEAARRLTLNPMLKTLVITGASQGATTVNEAALEVLKTVNVQGWQVLHLSGQEHAAPVRTEYRDLPQVDAQVLDFTPAMADVWAVADLAISRAGASSCAELTACGVPSILMPYPFHKDMHQRANAKVLADAGAAVLMNDEKDRRANASKLQPILEALLHDGNRRAVMSEAARKLSHPDAAANVAQVLIEIMRR